MRTGYIKIEKDTSLPPHPINIVNLRVGEWETGNYDEKNNLHIGPSRAYYKFKVKKIIIRSPKLKSK